jgi:CubicO group peptidase (beta-lactamase class C family)
LAAIALLGAQAGLAQTDVASAVDVYLRQEIKDQNIPGLAVAMIHRGEVLVARGYGLANIEHEVPVDDRTLFQSGSLGKQFTAAAVMLLAEDGSLSLDESVTTYLPEAPEEWAPITIRHLLTHTSGVADYTTEDFDYRRDYSEEDLAGMAYAQAREFPPGSRWNYSNTGYVLLGIVVGRVAGQFYGDFLRERVFDPLGMPSARIISEEDIVPHRASGYRLVDGHWKNQEWVSPSLNTTADGSLYVSLRDLIAWDKGLRSRAVLHEDSWNQVFERVRLTSGRPYPYGFGWFIEEVGEHAVHRHSGSWQGFVAYLARYVDEDLTVIALANLAEGKLSPIVEELAGFVNPALKPPNKPIEDTEPEVTERLRRILEAAAEGRLRPEEFSYVRAGFFPRAVTEFQEALQDMGDPREIALLERRLLGDDLGYRYRVAYKSKTVLVWLNLSPDGKISDFYLRPE